MFELFQGLAHDRIKFRDAKLEQNEFVNELERLKNKPARVDKYKKIKKDVLNNAGKLFEGRQMITDAFKKFKFKYTGTHYDYQVDKFIIEHAQIHINNELFHFKYFKHFKYSEPVDMVKDLLNIKDKDENNDLVNVIKSGLKDLKGRN